MREELRGNGQFYLWIDILMDVEQHDSNCSYTTSGIQSKVMLRLCLKSRNGLCHRGRGYHVNLWLRLTRGGRIPDKCFNTFIQFRDAPLWNAPGRGSSITRASRCP